MDERIDNSQESSIEIWRKTSQVVSIINGVRKPLRVPIKMTMAWMNPSGVRKHFNRSYNMRDGFNLEEQIYMMEEGIKSRCGGSPWITDELRDAWIEASREALSSD